jgi:hypothetical protein
MIVRCAADRVEAFAMKTVRLAVLALALSTALVSTAAPSVAQADVYMQHPRGSNNRLDESGGSSGGSLLWDLIDWFLG